MKLIKMSVKSALPAAMVLLASPVAAQTVSIGSYIPLFQGVSAATGTIGGESAEVLKIDLDAPGISFTTSPLCSGCTPTSGADVVLKEPTSQFLTSTGVAVAIDANTYINNDGEPTPSSEYGLQVSDGTLVNPDQSGYEDLLISQTNQAVFATGGTVSSLAGVYNAVAGQQGLILSDGTNTDLGGSGADRAGLGLSENGQYMYLVDVDDVSLTEEATLFYDIGAYSAVNLDGGASAELDIANGVGGATILNNSGTKDVGADLGIYAAPLAPVPLPPGMWLFGSGLLGLLGVGRRSFSARA